MTRVGRGRGRLARARRRRTRHGRGCGTGRVTERLVERLPHGHGRRRRRLERDGGARADTSLAVRDRVEVRGRRSLRARSPSTAPVDAILSTATFHWIVDHDALFANLAAVLRTGRAARGAMRWRRQHRDDPGCASRAGCSDFEGRKHFATADETRMRLERTGFTDVQTWLHDGPPSSPPGRRSRTWPRSVWAITSRGWPTMSGHASSAEVASSAPRAPGSTTSGSTSAHVAPA